MTGRPRICFIGNCQAQSLTSLAGHLGVDADVLILPPIFQTAAFSDPAIRRSIENCDFIFNQRVSDAYQLEWLRPSGVKQRFGNRSFSWPNIYFDGYFPGIQYLYSGERGEKLTGPLSDYHFSTVRDSWDKGQDVSVCVRSLLSDAPPATPAVPVERSLHELRTRELGLDVRISDYVADRFRISKIFYSMNHPSNEVLLEMLRRLLGHAGIVVARPDNVATFPYTLDKIDIPALPVFHRNYRPYFNDGEARIKGVSVILSADHAGEGPDEHMYTFEELVACYFRLYDWRRHRTAFGPASASVAAG